jgi:hypothetical protein
MPDGSMVTTTFKGWVKNLPWSGNQIGDEFETPNGAHWIWTALPDGSFEWVDP